MNPNIAPNTTSEGESNRVETIARSYQRAKAPDVYNSCTCFNDSTANTAVCIEKSQRCVLILSNDVRAEAGFSDLVQFILGDTGVPYDWEYGDYAGRSN